MKDAILVPLYINEVKGYIPRPRVICGQVRWKDGNWFIFYEQFKSNNDQPLFFLQMQHVGEWLIV